MADVLTQNADAADQPLEAIQGLLDDLARAAKSDASEREFYARLLSHTMRATAAAGAALWVRAGARPWRREYEALAARGAPWPDWPQRSSALDRAHSDGSPAAHEPRSAGGASPDAAAPGGHLLLLAPIAIDAQRAAVVEVLQRAEVSLAARRGALKFLAVIAEVAEAFHRERELAGLRGRDARSAAIDEFAYRTHASLRLDAAAYTIANEARRLVGADRVSVLKRRGRMCELLAASGVDLVNRRAEAAGKLERLVEAVAATREPLVFTNDTADLPPQLDEPLHAYLEASPARALVVVPLIEAPAPDDETERPRDVFGALVVERFDADRLDEDFHARLAALCRHGGQALARALEFEAQRAPIYTRLARATAVSAPVRRWRVTLAIMLVAAALAALAALVPAEFEVMARGQLQPRARRDVFAPADGVVREILVQHGEMVEANQPLATLRRPELDLEFARVVGERQTAAKRLAAVSSLRLDPNAPKYADVDRANELTSEEEQLKALLASLEEQYRILQAEQDALVVRSPMAGQIVTWDVTDRLAARPVERGQTLLTVADVAGPWVLEVDVRDRDVGHVLTARDRLGQPLAVDFALATEPGKTHRAVLDDVSLAAEADDADDEIVVVATAAVAEGQVERPRPGASVRAKIQCGQRSLGYVWLHDLWDAIQTWFLF